MTAVAVRHNPLKGFNSWRDESRQGDHVAAPARPLIPKEDLLVADMSSRCSIIVVHQQFHQHDAALVGGRHADGIDGAEEEAGPQAELHRLALRSTAQYRI